MQISQIRQANGSEVQTSEHSGLAYPIVRFRKGRLRNVEDTLAVEEPLEIRLCHGPIGARQIKSLSVTMRTPGNDCELAAGFLAIEAVIRDSADIQSIDWIACQPSVRSATALRISPSSDGRTSRYNTLQVEIHPDVRTWFLPNVHEGFSSTPFFRIIEPSAHYVEITGT
jgi:FdhD protein